MRDVLRPKPFRGDVVAAGVVVLTTLVWVLETRFDDAWPAGVHLAYAVAAFAFVTTMAVLAPMEGPSPRAYQSVLYLASVALALALLGNVADVLGGSLSPSASGTATWAFALVAALAFTFASRRNSAAATLVGALSAGVAVLAFVDWAFDPGGTRTFRWVLLALVAVYGLAAVGQRDRRPRHGVALADAAGIASASIGATFLIGDGEAGHAAWGWELLLVAAGFGLIAYSSVDRQPGPAYLGVLNLVLFVTLSLDDGSFLGWPLVLLLIAGALLWIGLRPTTPAPPPPDADAPPAPTAPLRR
jgi:peptidoglycan/LPS O-acetylase OafA/YrhL